MPKVLSREQIERFRDEGCVHPLRVMSEAEAGALRARLEDFERRTNGLLKGGTSPI